MLSLSPHFPFADIIDIVKDQLYGSDYTEEEDPSKYISKVTGRGPLTSDWIEDGYKNGKIMCAYKLCRVEFKCWGMQSRIERFIHDSALRRVMLRAHRQAWSWQDEWIHLTMDDIRKLEKEVQETLAHTMANCSAANNRDTSDAPAAGDGADAVDTISCNRNTSTDHSTDTVCKRKQSIKSNASSDDEFVDAE